MYFCGCNKTNPYQGEYIDISFKEKVTFGKSDSLSKSTIYKARDARLGPKNNIYVADAGVAKVKVYSPSGELVNSFGKRGRGPGELTSIKGFAVTDSTVLVWDQNLQRMTIFGLDGGFRKVHNFEGLPSPMNIYPLRDSYLAIHGDQLHGGQLGKINLGHTYSAEFSERREGFLTLDHVNEGFEKISRLLLTRPGNTLIYSSNHFLYVPTIYNGTIFEYKRDTGGWQKEKNHKGLNQQLPYSIVEEGDSRKPDGRMASVSTSKDKKFIAHNMSRGLLRYRDYIFHFTFTDIENKRVFGVEVYSKNVRPLGYAPIKSIPISNEPNNFLNWSVEAVDKKGNFYFLQRDDNGPTVQIMKINNQDLNSLVD